MMTTIGMLVLLAALALTLKIGVIDDDYDGLVAGETGFTLTITGPSGTPAAINIEAIEDLTPPVRDHKTDTWTPISGARSGLEQQIICGESSATIGAKVTYLEGNQVLMDAFVGVNGCAISLTGPDGVIFSGTGGMKKLGMDAVSADKHITSSLEFVLNAGWTCAAGS